MSSSSVGQSKDRLILRHTLQNDVAEVKKLLQEDKSLVHITYGNSGRTPLHVAAINNRLEVAKCLIDHGADVNALDQWKNTPLDDAEGAKKVNMIALLKMYGGLSYGENGSHSEPRPVSPPLPTKYDWEIDRYDLDYKITWPIGKDLTMARCKGLSGPVAIKTIHPIQTDEKLAMYVSATLSNCIMFSYMSTVHSSSVGQSKDQLILRHTLQNNFVEVKKLLQEDKSLVHTTYGNSRTPLHVAAINNRLEVAKCLIDHGADVNALDQWKNTPLDDAEGAKKVNMIALLKTYGGLSFGENGSHSEPRPVSLPLPTKYDWEIDRYDLDYKITLPIGKDLTMARCKGLYGPVAIKTIHPIQTDEKLAIQEFRHEVKLLMKLHHPNIVKVLGAVTDRKPLMLITEYVIWGNLLEFLIQKGPLEQSLAIHFAIHIARAMAYLHNEPNVIIYGDLKPRNILLENLSEDREPTTSLRLKLCGFGLSKRNDESFDNYTAPEVHKHKKYDKKSDVFSFAMILYRMLECEPSIFQPYYEPEASRNVAQVQRPTFRENAGLSPELIELIEQCWAEDPNERPHFLEILKKLEKIRDTYCHESTKTYSHLDIR